MTGISTKTDRTLNAAMALAAFMLPALALAVPSGYSLGAVVLCVLGATAWITHPRLVRRDADMLWFGMAVFSLATLWALDATLTHPFRVNGLDKPVKFALALVAIPAVLRTTPKAAALQWGVWIGALGAGATAAWQIAVMGMDRAWGYTNAIQFGNLALLMAVWSLIWSRQWPLQRAWPGWLACAAGVFAAIASDSRGAWWVALLIFPMVLLLRSGTHDSRAEGRGSHRARWILLAAMLAALATQLPRLSERTVAAWHEIQQHWQTGESDTSVGQRLAHWQLAWHMGLARPLTGWGDQGYQVEKERRISVGEAPAALQPFTHAHNEWLDMWAKHGIVGLALLLAFYAAPGWAHWRALQAGKGMGVPASGFTDTRHASALCGLVLVVGYLGFGMTQVMLAHNSSVIMYLFTNLLWLGAARVSPTE
jgi:O-antigen ligase